MSVEAGEVEVENPTRRQQQQQAEERRLAEMMIPKKKRRLYNKIMHSRKKSTQEVGGEGGLWGLMLTLLLV